MEIKKILAVSSILLFIGVAVAPSINLSVVKASNDDLVEVTTQACGITGYGNTKVKLTREQYQNLEEYLVDFRARLNQTTTREEAVPIFKEAVVELNKYGLLPKGMSVKQAQRLATGPYQNTKLLKCLEKLLDKSKNLSLQDGNAICLIYGEDQGYTYFQGPIMRLIYDGLVVLCEILFYISDTYIHRLSFIELMAFVFYFLYPVQTSISIKISEQVKNSPQIGSFIYYGFEACQAPMYPYYYPAEGTVWTIGLFGIKNWSGQFYGELSSLVLFYHDATLYSEAYFPGVNGFTGLRLYLNSTDFYFGSALNVNVGPDHP